jgi:hypothetical protein
VGVLSNNDGCAIARSDEAKALGLKMGAPYFQLCELERDAGLGLIYSLDRTLPITPQSPTSHPPHPGCR